MTKQVWVMKPIAEQRPCVNRNSFGVYAIYPSVEAAIAAKLDQVNDIDFEVVEATLEF